MPATEQTWYDMKRMHQIFAVTGVVLLLVTLWMFAVDHSREWKAYQAEARSIELQMTEWRQRQYETDAAETDHAELQLALSVARSKPLDVKVIDAFKQLLAEEAERREVSAPSTTTLDSQVARVNELAAEATKLRDEFIKLHSDAASLLDEADKAAAESTTLSATVDSAENPEQVQAQVKQLSDRAETLRKQAAVKLAKSNDEVEPALRDAEQATGAARAQVFATMQAFVDRATFREETAQNTRKILSAQIDAAKANVGLAVRDDLPTEALQAKVDKMMNDPREGLLALTTEYQKSGQHREDLEAALASLKVEEAEAEKELRDNQAELERLQKAYASERSTYVTWFGPGNVMPWPGKRVLELPILDAFSSPLQIENLWNDKLTIDYNFRRNRRFDRCTTCHQMMQKTQPGSAVKPSFLAQETVEMILQPPPQAEFRSLLEGEESQDDKERELTLLATYGFELAGGPGADDGGFLNRNAVTVRFVQPESPAAKARPATAVAGDTVGIELREALLESAELKTEEEPDRGLMVGDVIVAIDGDPITVRREAVSKFLNRIRIAENDEQPLRLTIRRGLPHPYSTHPRLDLFVGSLSPHKMSVYGCTICHEGQGSATDFKWASHSPNTTKELREWRDEHGWFDNHHWIYPMYPSRYMESTCLKCHHDVTELRPSDDFPEAPAPKVTHGFDVIAKYGCYGCHEINGWDGPNRRVGPDMRLEPQFFAAAQQIMADEGFKKLSPSQQALAKHVANHPEDDVVRHQLLEVVQADIALTKAIKAVNEVAADSNPATEEGGEAKADAMPVLSAESHSMASLLGDVETPGTMRKSGPSFRFIADKVDGTFLFDWIRNPQQLRPSSRMPRFFGLWDHIEEPEQLSETEHLETVEILAMSTYLLAKSQPFEPLKPVVEQGDAERGKQLFQTRGCLACHTHSDPELKRMEDFRPVGEIVQGPELSNLAEKFDTKRNPKGKAWLYSWIKEPTRYHVRTVMPNLFLDPITGPDGEVTDPVSDIVEFLLTSDDEAASADVESRLAELPVAIDTAGKAVKLSEDNQKWLRMLTVDHMKGQFRDQTALKYTREGIPYERLESLKGAEVEMLLTPDEQAEIDAKIAGGAEPKAARAELIEKKRLLYVGRKSIAKYGCYGCHDVPGFEGAKSIGAGLADWGRKDSSKLAFEHIANYLEHHGSSGHGHGHGGGEEHADDDHKDADHEADEHEAGEHDTDPVDPVMSDRVASFGEGTLGELDPYSEHMLMSGHREGFIAQKLRGPRTYDYHKIGNKGYNERLRMPLFPITDEERDAVMTFVLGLIADPPAESFVYKPSPRKQAIQEGERILEKYNCSGCHVLELEKWDVQYPPDHFASDFSQPASSLNSIYPFLRSTASPSQVNESLEVNSQGLRSARIVGMPSIGNDALATVYDDEGDPIEDDDDYDPSSVIYSFDLWEPAVLDGEVFEPAILPLRIAPEMIDSKQSVRGGDLTRYLLPVVTKIEKQSNPAAKGSEAYAWLPPPLVGEGRKVQTEWLHDFLLEPYPIRPAVFLRMPKFNMSRDEASKLANYFAAVDDVAYPYDFSERRLDTMLTAKESLYRQAAGGDGDKAEGSDRFRDAMSIVTNNNYCVKCHVVGDFRPVGADRALAPNLAVVFERLRGPYLRNWIARPNYYLPYTAMPVNVPFDPDAPHLGGVDQGLFHGTSVEQVEGLTDLLMNFDGYAKQQISISQQTKDAEDAAKAAAEKAAAEAAKPDEGDAP